VVVSRRGSVVPAGIGKFPFVLKLLQRDWLKLLNNEIGNKVN